MRPFIVSTIAFLAGGVLVYSVSEGMSLSMNDLAEAIGIDETTKTSAVVAQADTTKTNVENAPTDAVQSGAAEPSQLKTETKASEQSESTDQAPVSAYAPAVKPAIDMPPIGLPDPDEAQKALPAGQKITLKAAPVEAPEIGEISWVPASLYCGFVEAELPEQLELAALDDGAVAIDAMPEASDDSETAAKAVEDQSPEAFVFVTERHYDGRAAVERGYMRLGGLMRELALKDVKEAEGGETRQYQTFGGAPVEVRIDMQRIMTDADKRLKAWHKPPRLLYRGAITVSRGEATRQAGFVGSCS